MVLGRHQFPVPCEQRVRGDDAGQTVQHGSSEHLGPHCQPSALVVGEPQTPSTQLFAQHPVLLAEIVDHILLTAVDKARDSDNEKLQEEAVPDAQPTLALHPLDHGPCAGRVGLLAGRISLSPVAGNQL